MSDGGVWRTGTCSDCGQYFSYHAPNWKGRSRAFCDKHDAKHKATVNADKQARYRRSHKMKNGTSEITQDSVMHICNSNGITLCDMALDRVASVAQMYTPYPKANKLPYCQTCIDRLIGWAGVEDGDND